MGGVQVVDRWVAGWMIDFRVVDDHLLGDHWMGG